MNGTLYLSNSRIFFLFSRSNANTEKPKPSPAEDSTPKSSSSLGLLGDLPPLGPPSSGGLKNPAMTLAPLKKIPPVAKVEATKKEDIPTVVKNAKPALEVKPMSKTNSTTNITEPESNTASVSVDEDIDEEIDEFLNSSISASEDFTKEETVSEEASLKADFVDKF